MITSEKEVTSFINVSNIRKYCKANGKRCGKDFIQRVNQNVGYYLKRAVETHNGSKKTLDNTVAVFIGMKV